MLIATLVAPSRLANGDVSAASDGLRDAGAQVAGVDAIEPGIAIDLRFDGIDGAAARAAVEAAVPHVDVIVQPFAGRTKRLLIADMDSTMITIECIDELADYAGVKPEVAAVTEAAMRGDLDFEGALDARVALLKGMAIDAIDRCHAERVRITPGAVALVRTMRANGARTVLVSGGFTAFTGPVAKAIGFDVAFANTLGVEGGRLTGTVARPVVTAAVKRATLDREAAAAGVALADCLAVGDGANDIPMIEAAGLGVAYHAKPRTEAAAGAAIRNGDLSVLLYAQGYARRAWVEE